jgi:transcription elongation factor GreB
MIKKDNYITPIGHQKLVDELNQLVLNERPEITKVIQWAAGNGDRSENADYIYGKRRLREIDKRSNFLRKRIERSVIVDPEKIISPINIKFGATVYTLDENSLEKRYTIVGVDEIDLSKGHISWKSPIGRALLNKKVGEVAEITLHSGSFELEISRFEYIKIV